MTVRVKICGLTRPDAIAACAEAGVDAVGFVFHHASPRFVSPARAAELAGPLPPGVQRVAVCLHPQQEFVDEILTVLHPDWLQTDVEDFQSLRLPSGIRPLPVLRDDTETEPPAGGPLVFEGVRSGAGMRSDWTRAAALARRAKLILAGGLHPDNVAEAIREVRPYGVDVSSGVESEPGVKDPDRIHAFVAAARAVQGSDESSELEI